MGKNFNGYNELILYLEGAGKRIKDVDNIALERIGKHLQMALRTKHGKGYSDWDVSIFNPNSPLLKTGGLRAAVAYKRKSNEVIVYSNKEWLALIHEYGARIKMTDKMRKYLFAVVIKDGKVSTSPRNTWGSGYVVIPARPLWRRMLKQENKAIIMSVQKLLDTIFV